ncbi:MAG: metallophosphoesterase [Candidatus Eisenbacteria bacterium]|nr:metallophosphoesterase [Candidatus Eisenbacteria bacterium]
MRLRWLWIALVPFAAILIYGTLIEPARLVVREVRVPSPPLARFFGGATVVHVSDLHTRGIGRRERLLLEALEKIDPDYVFVTGDYVHANRSREPALELLRRFPGRAEVWGVLGNVDYDGSRESCLLCHVGGPGGPLRGREPIRMLRNEAIDLERDGRRLRLIGLDEMDTRAQGGDPDRLLSAPADSIPVVILAHTPWMLERAADSGADLFLAGDTHGGQIAAPKALLERFLSDKDWRYRRGRFRVGGLWLHVDSGVGWSIFPVRFGMPPEITVLRFTEEEE